MTSSPDKPDPIPIQAPAARPETTVEVDEAKKKVAKRARRAMGRESTILAGQLTQRRRDNELKQILG
jgi:hypothetical protein